MTLPKHLRRRSYRAYPSLWYEMRLFMFTDLLAVPIAPGINHTEAYLEGLFNIPSVHAPTLPRDWAHKVLLPYYKEKVGALHWPPAGEQPTRYCARSVDAHDGIEHRWLPRGALIIALEKETHSIDGRSYCWLAYIYLPFLDKNTSWKFHLQGLPPTCTTPFHLSQSMSTMSEKRREKRTIPAPP